MAKARKRKPFLFILEAATIAISFLLLSTITMAIAKPLTTNLTMPIFHMAAASSPTTQILVDAEPDADSGWFSAVPNISFEVDRPAETFYQWDSTSTSGWQKFVNPFLASNGDHLLYYYSSDTSGSEEAIQEDEIDVDVEKPVISSFIMPQNGSTVSDTVTIDINATDTLSGIDDVALVIDGHIVDDMEDAPFSFKIDTRKFVNGEHVIEIYVYDWVGNKAVEKRLLVFKNPEMNSASVSQGNNIVVSLGQKFSFKFQRISTPGTMSIIESNDIYPPSSAYYSLLSPIYKVNTDFAYSGPIEISYLDSLFKSTTETSALRILQWNGSGSGWSPAALINTIGVKPVRALMSELTPFVIAKVTPSGKNLFNRAPSVAAPTGIKINNSNNTIHLTWAASAQADLSGYRIYRLDGKSNLTNLAGMQPLATISVTYFDDACISKGVYYTYYVTAVNNAGNESKPARVYAIYGELKPRAVITKPVACFSDVPSGAWYRDSVLKLLNKKITCGYSDGTFRPIGSITRAEFTKMICQAMGWTVGAPNKQSFNDTTKKHWAYNYIETAKSQGIIGGYSNGGFNPEKKITRAEIASIIARTLNLSDNTTGAVLDVSGSWAKGSIGACMKAGIVGGYPNSTFKPNNTASRAEVAKMIANLVDKVS